MTPYFFVEGKEEEACDHSARTYGLAAPVLAFGGEAQN
jgi:hypothetical protein